jgi:predicted nucleic acid-binding protein
MNGTAPTDLVLDASVAIKWYVPEGLAVEALRLMSPRFSMHVPSFFAAECGNTIWKKVAQRRELDRENGREILDELLAYPKQVHDAEALTMLAYDLAHEVGDARMAIDDFICLALAVALDCQMVTADGPFRDVVRATPFGHRLLWVADPI